MEKAKTCLFRQNRTLNYPCTMAQPKFIKLQSVTTTHNTFFQTSKKSWIVFMIVLTCHPLFSLDSLYQNHLSLYLSLPFFLFLSLCLALRVSGVTLHRDQQTHKSLNFKNPQKKELCNQQINIVNLSLVHILFKVVSFNWFALLKAQNFHGQDQTWQKRPWLIHH